MIYMISDHHFFHKNIIAYENRPYSTVEEMNNDMIEKWNSVVRKDDFVYHLGDFSWTVNKDMIKDIMCRLNGSKVLIMGNHDRKKSTNYWREIGFLEAYRFPIIYDEFYILSHEPIYLNEHVPYANIHGHLHTKNYDSKQYVNVSVEQLGYVPIKFEEIKNKFIEEEDED